MKADRLVATLLLLQAKGRVTAADVAAELEISERTARRDLEALSMAGIPVYSQPGRGGGWSLVGDARTDLTGLRAPEVRALFLTAGAATATTPELKAALRKLVQALPEPFRDDAQAATESVVVDPSRWGAAPVRMVDEPLLLDDAQRAVIQREQIVLEYRSPQSGKSTRTVHPLGLVTKASVWYLIAGTDRGQRTFRVDRMISIEQTGTPAERPADFDLQAAWNEITVGYEEQTHPFSARCVAERWTFEPLRALGVRFEVETERNDGRFDLRLSGSSLRIMSVRIAGLVGGLEITDPPELIEELGRLGHRLVDHYDRPLSSA